MDRKQRKELKKREKLTEELNQLLDANNEILSRTKEIENHNIEILNDKSNNVDLSNKKKKKNRKQRRELKKITEELNKLLDANNEILNRTKEKPKEEVENYNIEFLNDKSVNVDLSKEKIKIDIGLISAFVLMIANIILLFVTKSFYTSILSIISLIICLINIKKLNILNLVSIIGSFCIILFAIISIIINLNGLKEAKEDTRKREEEILETGANYITMSKVISKEEVNELILLKDDFDEYNQVYPEKCEFYVIVNYKENKYKSYMKCSDYTTIGFDRKYLEGR